MSFEKSWHPTIHAAEERTVINYSKCELCSGEFYPDSVQTGYCDRPICREVRMFWAKELKRENHLLKMPGARRRNS